MAAHTTYVADGPVDDWAPVGEVAKQLRGDCEDLIHLEHSLILAALADAGLSNPKPKSHAAYVSVNGKREGHVYMTVEIDGRRLCWIHPWHQGNRWPYLIISPCMMLRMFLVIVQREQPFIHLRFGPANRLVFGGFSG